jgi:hypothetical protein
MIILLTATLLTSAGAVAAWHVVESYAAEMDLSSDEVPATASCLASLLTDNPKTEIGDMVFLNDVKLRPGPRSTIFIAIGTRGKRLLVRWKTTKQIGQRTPQIVDIKGIIRQMPTPGILHTEWMLSKKQIDMLERQNVYIEAESIETQN